MSIQMRGAEVAKAMKEKLIREREELNAAGVNPCLTIIRVGAKENDLAYERGAKKRMEMIGIECRIVELPEDISQEEFEDAFCKINNCLLYTSIRCFREFMVLPIRRKQSLKNICI